MGMQKLWRYSYGIMRTYRGQKDTAEIYIKDLLNSYLRGF